jgi:hypothetical protein
VFQRGRCGFPGAKIARSFYSQWNELKFADISPRNVDCVSRSVSRFLKRESPCFCMIGTGATTEHPSVHLERPGASSSSRTTLDVVLVVGGRVWILVLVMVDRLFHIVEILRKICFLGARGHSKQQIGVVQTPPAAGRLDCMHICSIHSRGPFTT